MKKTHYPQELCPVSGETPAEEVANFLTHGIGLILSLSGAMALISLAALYGDALHVVSCLIYSLGMIMLFGISTLYHSRRNPKVKRIFRILDHACIYIMIAGTYTPFTIGSLRNTLGWSLFTIIWSLAIAGIILKIFYTGKFIKTSTFVYIAMGWLAIVAAFPIIDHITIHGFIWIIAGGVLYTGGTIFFLWESLPFNHAIWHLFVIGGGFCHYWTITFYVLPIG